MGKLSTRKPERIPSEEIQGRILSGFAGPSLSEQLKAYELALGPKNVSASSYVEAEPSVMVKRNGEWVSPDKGTDIYDLTTDVIPDLPAILGGGFGAAYGGTQGAVGGATAGNLVKQKIGESLGLRDGINETEAKLEGIGELVGPIGGKALAMVPMPNVAAMTVLDVKMPRGVDLHAFESTAHPNQITVSKIIVPKNERGSGLGTEAMNKIIEYADKNGKSIALTPSTDFGGSSVARLKEFYKRFGFIENKGRKYDPSLSESMYRPAKDYKP